MPGRVLALSARPTCMPFPSPGVSKRSCSHGPAPPPRDVPPVLPAALPDHRDHVCTKEAEEKENLLYLPTENQYVQANQPREL